MEETPVRNKKTKRLWILLAGLLIILLLFGGYLFYLYSSGLFDICLMVLTPARNTKTGECKTFGSSCIPIDWKSDQSCAKIDETVYTEATRSANWKTYKSMLYGYSVKLPPELFTDEIVNRVDIKTKPPGYPSASISVVTSPNDFEFKFLSQFLSMKINDQKKISGEFDGFNIFKRLPNEIVADDTVMVFENSKVYEFIGKGRKWIIQKGEKTYMLNLYYQTDEELNKYKMIFSTLKFTQ